MTPREVAAVLREISQLLQLKGENAFKVRAYDLGADAFETLPPDPAARGGLYERVKAGTLCELEGVGKAIEQEVTELVNAGKLDYLEKLRLEFPRGALDLVQIPGLGPRKAAALIHELDVANLDDLEKAAREGRVRGLKGFGEKTEASILEGIAKVRVRQAARKPLWETRPLAEQLVARVRSAPGVARAEIAGSVRRYNETNGDIDIVAAVNGPVEPVMEAFAVAPGVAEVLARGGTKCSVRLRDGLQADLRVVGEAQFATALHHFTGSKQHHVKLRGIARDKGLSISEYGLARLDGGPSLQPESEEALYGLLGLQPVPPELREDLGELELAAKRALPELIEQRDIRGFVHCHSTWSDGRATLEEMVRAAHALGAEFITITDHTRAAHYANGLDVDRLRRQWDEIALVQEKVPQIRILRGSEVSPETRQGSAGKADSLVESSRGNRVTAAVERGKGKWSTGQTTSGAVVLPNWDQDNTRPIQAPDIWKGGKWNAADAAAPANTTVDGNGDTSDIAPLYINELPNILPKEQVTLTVSVPPDTSESAFFQGVRAEDRIRVFLPSMASGNDKVIQANDKAI